MMLDLPLETAQDTNCCFSEADLCHWDVPRGAPAHDGDGLPDAGSSTCSLRRSGACRHSARLLTPVLAATAPEIWITQPGAPPRISALQNRYSQKLPEVPERRASDSGPRSKTSKAGRRCADGLETASWEPEVPVPRLRLWQHLKQQRRRLGSAGAEGVPSMASTSTLARVSTAGGGSQSARTAASLSAPRPPSPTVVMEHLYLRGSLPKGAMTQRSCLDEPLAQRDALEADFARHRQEQLKLAQNKSRELAVKWRAKNTRMLNVCKLEWQFQDPEAAAPFNKSGTRNTTPVWEAGLEEYRRMSVANEDKRLTSSLLKDSGLKLSRPREQRMKHLRSLTRKRWQDKRDPDPLGGMSRIDGGKSKATLFERLKAKRLSSGTSIRSSIERHVASVPRSADSYEELDKQVLEEAFTQCDADLNGVLDHAELPSAVAKIGLRPKTQAEREAVREIIWSFDVVAFDAALFIGEFVTKVREKFAMLRRPRLVLVFKENDVLGQGALSAEDILNTVRRHGIWVSDTTFERAMFCYMLKIQSVEAKTFSLKDVVLNVEGFVVFNLLLEEYCDRQGCGEVLRIRDTYKLPEEYFDVFEHDLVDFYRMFHEYDPCNGKYGSPSGSLTQGHMWTVIRESGFMPKTRARQVGAFQLMKMKARSDGTFTFPEFLSLMRDLRELDRERLRKCIDPKMAPYTDTGAVPSIPIKEMFGFLTEIGFQPRTADEKTEFKALIEDSDASDTGVLLKADIVILCQRINARVRAMQHERERQYVLSAGWTAENFADFRTAFQDFDEDFSEVLERDELMKAVDVLKGHYWQSQGNIDLMFMALGINPNKKIEVNFLTFLRMLKMLDESEARRNQGDHFAFSRDTTDKLYSAFQALEPESTNFVTRETVERALGQVAVKAVTRLQLSEVLRVLSQEPGHIEFYAFLRTMKTLEGLVVEAGAFEEVLDDLLSWVDTGDPAPALAEDMGPGSSGAGTDFHGHVQTSFCKAIA